MDDLRRAVFVLAVLVSVAPAAHGQSRAERSEAYLASFHELRLFNGAALVIDNGQTLFEGAFGAADLDAGVLATATTRYRIASLTKQFTAALILRLEEEGLLEVTAPVSAYVPEYPAPNGDRITLHHLLTHTSGLPSYTDLPGFMETYAERPTTPGGILEMTWDKPLNFEPGAQFEYSNSGYVLLGWIAERVTGKPYHEALREFVLDPLELNDTGYDHDLIPADGHAKGHTRTLVGYDDARSIHPSVPYSGGMLYSTVGDLARWTAQLADWDPNPRLFRDSATLDRMLTPELESYAYGIIARTADIGRETGVFVIEHSGEVPGFRSIVRAFPDHHRLVILLDNTSSDLGPILQGLTNLLWGAEAVPPKASIAERIMPVIESAGVEPAIARYRNWRRTRPDEYDYDPGQLMALANHYRERDPEIAIALLEAQAEEIPEAPITRFALSQLIALAGDTVRAAAHVETALTYNPGLPQLIARLQQLGLDPDPVLRFPIVAVDHEDLVMLVGSYRIDPATTLEVVMDDGELWASRTGEPAFRLLPQSPTTFLLHGSKLQFVFEIDGEVASTVSVVEAGQDVTFPRIAGDR